jgi:CheY-like chemotaxis protein
MAKLVVMSKVLAGSSHDLGDSWVTIGRADGNAFQIVESSISGRHCEARLQGEELLVRDLQSTNGTFVRGEKITEAVLKLGQSFRVGEIEMRFEVSAPVGLLGKAFITKKPDAIPLTPISAASNSTPSADEPAKKHQVLFVDDSMAFLDSFSQLCSNFSKKTWAIHTATTADRALAILQETPMDLVVLDVGMPLVDGLQLLVIINRRYPGIKTAIITGSTTESKRADALAGGASLFMEKPVSSEGFRIAFNMLNDLVSWSQQKGFSGALQQVGLQEIIQIECIGCHSSILEVRNSRIRGQIYIEAGAIVHATVENLAGETAFYKLLSLTGGEFQVKPFKAPEQRTIRQGWEFLIMEAARRVDEETAMITKASVTNPATAANPIAPVEELSSQAPAIDEKEEHTAMGDDIVVVATYDGQWMSANGSEKSPR